MLRNVLSALPAQPAPSEIFAAIEHALFHSPAKTALAESPHQKIFVHRAIVAQGGNFGILRDDAGHGHFSVKNQLNCCSGEALGPHSIKSAAALAGRREANCEAESEAMGLMLAKKWMP